MKPRLSEETMAAWKAEFDLCRTCEAVEKTGSAFIAMLNKLPAFPPVSQQDKIIAYSNRRYNAVFKLEKENDRTNRRRVRT